MRAHGRNAGIPVEREGAAQRDERNPQAIGNGFASRADLIRNQYLGAGSLQGCWRLLEANALRALHPIERLSQGCPTACLPDLRYLPLHFALGKC